VRVARRSGCPSLHCRAVSTTPKAAKRYRKRQNKQAAQAARHAALQQAKRRRRTRLVVPVVLVAVALLVLMAVQSTKNDNKVSPVLAAFNKLPAQRFTTNCPSTVKAGPKSFPKAPGRGIDPKKKYTAVIDTDLGTMKAALDPKAAPITVNSFVFLACQGFFDGLKFHRVVDNFVIQGGDPAGTGSGGPNYTLPEEPPADGKYPKGSLAMAKTSAPHSTGSQFFVVTGDPAALEQTKTYSWFGKLTSGLDVAQKIEKQHAPQANFDGPPTPDVHMTKVRITESG